MLETVNNAQIDPAVYAIKDMSGAIRNLTRRLGIAGSAFVERLGMLPVDTYNSVMCGGFKIIINAAILHRELCQEVFDALGEILEVIKGAKFSFDEYKSEDLHMRVARL